ncbi:MAG: hypothetical protein EYC69_06525 [Bacteroidetes bacterium]|nr:MAG: hypothetical protein EYC69_06525 [Bacteroidota bacterium]
MLSVSNIGLSVREYGITKQADYIRANQVLPSGTYSVCYSVFDVYGEGLSSNCFDISSEINSNLILVSPFNNEIVETAFPVLSWFHSEPFDVLDEGEYYRMIVCEILEDESPGSAIADENPVFVKENLYDHQVPYPIDAISLKEGSRYAWEVQKVNRNNIIQRTDPWVFQLKSHENQKDIKYAVLSKQVDGGYYTVRNNRLYFRFDDYYSGEKLNCTIYDKTNKPVSVSPSNEKFGKEGKGMLEHGYNRFIIELEKYGLGKGIFLLEVRNSKNELFKLKFKLD